MIIDLFAGPGGRDEGLRLLGRTDVLGIEIDETACSTAEAAGHARLRADVTALDPRDFGGVEGQVASPVCRPFSMAGSRLGIGDAPLLLAAIEDMAAGRDVLAELSEKVADQRSLLALEPLRWALGSRSRLAGMGAGPDWLAWEQVPAVLPLWEACAVVLRELGYFVRVGIVRSEQYKVPQVRRRAELLASRHGSFPWPPAVRSRYYSNAPERLDAGLPRWLSMAEGCGWGMTHRPSMTVTGGGSSTGGAEPFGNQARKTMLREMEAGRWLGEPMQRGRRLTVAEAAALQSFPVDYPFQGGMGKQFQQIGDAVPPLLDAHCFAALGVGSLRAMSASDLRSVA